MAIDPSDLLEPPYNFGECEEFEVYAGAHCGAWDYTMGAPIYIRKQGNLVIIIVPELIANSNSLPNKDIIQFNLDNLADDEKERVLGKNPKSMRFLTAGLNGIISENKGNSSEICFCTVDMDFKGNFYIAPEADDEGFCCYGKKLNIGTFSFSFVYEIDNAERMEDEEEEGEEEEGYLDGDENSDYAEEPEQKEIKLG